MTFSLPLEDTIFPIILPDGSPHEGTVFLKNVIDHPKFEVGSFTYASDFAPPAKDGWASRLAPYLFPFSQETLKIGRFCQIADGVRFITSSANHEMNGISTFPFSVFDQDARAGFQPDTRDTVIGHDVWLGTGAIVMPGANVGNGVIVGAGAVVRGNVPAYSVVTGNPASVARSRFSKEEITELENLKWWDWDPDRVAAAHGALSAGDIPALRKFSSQ